MAYKCCSLYNGICGAKRVQKKENMMLTEKASEQTYKKSEARKMEATDTERGPGVPKSL